MWFPKGFGSPMHMPLPVAAHSLLSWSRSIHGLSLHSRSSILLASLSPWVLHSSLAFIPSAAWTSFQGLFTLPSFEIWCTLHKDHTISFCIPIKLAPPGQHQGQLAMEAAARLPWTVTTVPSSCLDSWAW